MTTPVFATSYGPSRDWTIGSSSQLDPNSWRVGIEEYDYEYHPGDSESPASGGFHFTNVYVGRYHFQTELSAAWLIGIAAALLITAFALVALAITRLCVRPASANAKQA